MNTFSRKKPFYPKGHLLAASGIAAVLSLVLLVFPSREVEAKRSLLEYNFDAAHPELQSLEQDLQKAVETEAAMGDELSVKGFIPEASEVASLSVVSPVKNSTAAPKKSPSAQKSEPKSQQIQKITVGKGDTFSDIMARVGQSAAVVHELLDSSREARKLVRLHRGQVLEFQLKHDELQQVRTRLDPLRTLVVERDNNGVYQTRVEKAEAEIASSYAKGVINSNLISAARDAGLSYGMTMDLANIFAYDIDFALDIQKGDSFEVLYETRVARGKTLGGGKILAARFTNQGKTYTAIRYKTRTGSEEFYNAQGESLRKAFIRTPVDFARITSGFSMGRRHPILNKIRAHKGVDYAAPSGTPIKSAGSGKVVLAGRNGGYGNTVIVQHGDRYRTLYAHMQGFAKGVRTGSVVKQGQVIGYIGTTGLSTGPHLHYEFQVDGNHVDPLSEKLPMSNPIVAKEKPRFLQHSKSLWAQMDRERTTQLALNQQ